MRPGHLVSMRVLYDQSSDSRWRHTTCVRGRVRLVIFERMSGVGKADSDLGLRVLL